MARETRRPKGTGSRVAYEEIRAQILSLELEPGQELEEALLLKKLGVSRTPIREALIQLAAEGLVEMLPNRGARASNVELSRVREFFEALDAYQRMVTRWAALRRTPEHLKAIDQRRREFEACVKAGDVSGMMDTNLHFHQAIAAASGNELVAKHYAQLLAFGLRLSRIALVYDGEGHGRDRHIENIIAEHREMVAHITAGDADAAEAVARNHAAIFRERVLVYVASNLSTDMKF